MDIEFKVLLEEYSKAYMALMLGSKPVTAEVRLIRSFEGIKDYCDAIKRDAFTDGYAQGIIDDA